MQIRVKPVEGRMVLDPRTIGGRQHLRIGYERVVEGEKVLLGRKEPRVRFKFVGGEHVVTETNDGYFRAAILNGDLDYIEHVGPDGEPMRADLSLVAATARNVKAREDAASAALAQDASEAAAYEAALAAAKRGEDPAVKTESSDQTVEEH